MPDPAEDCRHVQGAGCDFLGTTPVAEPCAGEDTADDERDATRTVDFLILSWAEP